MGRRMPFLAVLAELKTAVAAAPGEPRLGAMHTVVRGQAHHLRGPETAGDPGFVPRQLCLQAAELGESLLATDFRTRQLASGDPGPLLQWSARRASPALIFELGRDEGWVRAVAVLPDGRVVSSGDGNQVRLRSVQSSSPGTLLACSASALALATSLSQSGAHLVIGHAMGGISCWEVRTTAQNTSGARQRAGNTMHQQT